MDYSLVVLVLLTVLLVETCVERDISHAVSFFRLSTLTLVLALLDSIILDPASVIGVLHAWFDLTVGKGTCETGEKLLGLLVGSWLACGSTVSMHVIEALQIRE